MRKYCCVFTLALLAAGPAATQSENDFDLRVEVLRAVFPGALVERAALHREDLTLKLLDRSPMIFPDALLPQALFSVTGKPLDDLERCAAEDLLTHRMMEMRQVRFQLNPWPGTRRDLLAVMQYRFEGAKPSSNCTSIAEAIRLTPAGAGKRNGPEWEVKERIVFEARRHHHLESVQVVQAPDGEEDLFVESDSGDTDQFGSELRVFDLSRGYFFEILRVPTRVRIPLRAEQWTQSLDLMRTAEQHGSQFCFSKTVYAMDLRWLPKPVVTGACYDRGYGVTNASAGR
jgi:hypothetical protein